jgi:multiple sugar transport system ATP-binding protein
MRSRLELRRLAKSFDRVPAVRGLDLGIGEGEFLSLLGPSGCGKSTTLAMITGLVEPDSGEVCVDGQVVNDLPPHRRDLGLVFQDYAVFSRLSVRQNLSFGLEARGIGRRERTARVADMAQRLGLETLLPSRGATLNMSEMQRVAIARVLVTNPRILLLDEPMSNLDASVRASLRTELKQIQSELRQTVLYVTHDQSEAMAMSDRIAVMDAGEIQQIGSPDAIYHNPRTRFVAEFIGDPPMNILPCDVVRSGPTVAVRTALHGPIPLGDLVSGAETHLLGVRPHDVIPVPPGTPGAATTRVRFVENLGAEHVLHVDYGDRLLAVIARPNQVREGEEIAIALRSGALHLIRETDGLVLQPRRTETAA